jgi:hypothetical protein
MSDPAPKKFTKPNIPGTGTVFDVKRPGKAPIQTTSRPVIVGHKSIVRDPFTTGKPASAAPLLQTKQKVTVPVDSTPSPHPVSEASAAPSSTPASPELAAIAAELTQSEAVKPEVIQGTVAPEPAKPVIMSEAKDDLSWKLDGDDDTPKDYIPGSTTPVLPPEPVKKQAPLSPELKKQLDAAAEENSPAPEPKGVIVSDDHGPLQLGKVLLWFVAVIVLVAVVGDLLLDAGTITTSVSIPHTNFIK